MESTTILLLEGRHKAAHKYITAIRNTPYSKNQSWSTFADQLRISEWWIVFKCVPRSHAQAMRQGL